MQPAIDGLGLIALAPVATAVVQGSLRLCQNRNIGEGVVIRCPAAVVGAAPTEALQATAASVNVQISSEQHVRTAGRIAEVAC